MPMAYLFWLLIILAIVLDVWWRWPAGGWAGIGSGLLLFAAICVLGWKVFGPMVHG